MNIHAMILFIQLYRSCNFSYIHDVSCDSDWPHDVWTQNARPSYSEGHAEIRGLKWCKQLD